MMSRTNTSYSLDVLNEWVQDALNSDATPEEIYDCIMTSISDNINYHRACLNASKKLLRIMDRSPKKVITFDRKDESLESTQAWQEFWEEDKVVPIVREEDC